MKRIDTHLDAEFRVLICGGFNVVLGHAQFDPHSHSGGQSESRNHGVHVGDGVDSRVC